MSPFPAGFPIKDLIVENRSFVDHKQQAVSALVIEHAKHVDTAAVPGGPQSVADLRRAAFRRQQQRARRQALQQRAAASPLAQVCWRSVTTAETMEPAA
jgi:hypothetical protein